MTLLAVVSSLLWAGAVRAHEVMPTIAGLTMEGDAVTLDMRATLEAFVAGVDLDGLEDTDASDRAERYDALRALPPEAFAEEVRAFWPSMELRLMADGEPVALRLAEVRVEPAPDLELSRASHAVLAGALPAGTQSISLYWPTGFGALILRQQGAEDPFTGYLNGGETSPPISVSGGDAASIGATFLSYIPVGFDHILPKGLDHILFVLGLFFLSPRLRPLLWQVSAFTLAHTVTLALGALDIVRVPGAIVEPLIAASIAYVAVENILSRGLTPWRPVVVFLFGLLHGLGFASVLGEFGLPPGGFVAALIGFNVGVELGQLTVIAAAFLAVGYWFGDKPWYRGAIAIPASVIIGVIGAYWVVERTLL
ncbi:HupE / UreJ protein [Poseidonocella pacifica]|uniref:HupE / UreJ protein n=1 Tax=Poseidonocella pacifica TaxID=871651 RepID=A0A1I0VLF9_9RHOB|nr:HupE / UreJ protein [Poseidonocella pacifica]